MSGFSLRSAAWRALLVVPLLAASPSCGGGGGGGGGEAPQDPFDLASVTPDPTQAAKDSFAGLFAADYLRATHFDRLIVEVAYPDDRTPIQASLDLLQERLSERCDKPDGVEVVLGAAIPVDEFDERLSTGALEDLEDAHRIVYSDSSTRTAAMFVLYVHGHSSLDTFTGNVIGLSYRGGSFAIFVDRVGESATPPLVTEAEIEGGTIVHEAGHLLGLVNNGVPMQQAHEDNQHGLHDISTACVMYYVIQVPFGSPNIGDPDFMQYDPNCMNDLHAFGGLPPSPAPAFVGATSDGLEPLQVGICPCCGRSPPR